MIVCECVIVFGSSDEQRAARSERRLDAARSGIPHGLAPIAGDRGRGGSAGVARVPTMGSSVVKWDALPCAVMRVCFLPAVGMGGGR